MSNIIDKIQVSGNSYDVKDKSATTVVALTQAQYNVLPSSAKTANILYNITDAQGGDLSNYWTTAETQSAITEAVSGKADTNNTVQSVGLSTLADGKSITAVIPSGNTYTATIFKVGNGLTWQAYNSTIVVDTSKIAQKTDIPTVSSAITSGSTDSEIPTAKAVYTAIPIVTNTITSGSTEAITSGAVYDAIGDIETLLSQI
jgi:hypothetical protein